MNTEPTLQSLAGMTVSHVWFSDHFICYLELGQLSPGRVRRDGSVGNSVGEVTVFLGYDWLAAWSDANIRRRDVNEHKEILDAMTKRIAGATVQSAVLSSGSLELEIVLSSGITLTSASDAGEDPDWDVGFRKYRDGYLCIENEELQYRLGTP